MSKYKYFCRTALLHISLISISNNLFCQNLVVDSLWGNNGLVSMDANNGNNQGYFIFSQLVPSSDLSAQEVKHFGLALINWDVPFREFRHFTSTSCLDSTSDIVNQIESERGGLFCKYNNLYSGYYEGQAGGFYPTIKQEIGSGVFDEEFEMNFRSNFDTWGIYVGSITSVCPTDSENTFIASGYASNSNYNNNFIARYLLSGLIDSTYGINGYVSVNEFNYDFSFFSNLNHLIRLENGTTVISGTCRDTANSIMYFFVAGYNSDGMLINEFGTNGLFLKEVEGAPNYSPSPLQYDDGFISLLENNTNHLSLIKIKHEGAIDSSFGNNGVVSLDDVLDDFNSFNTIYKNNDSTLFVISNLNNGNNGRIKLYKTNGQLVTTFGQDGEFELNIPGYQTKIHSIVPISETEYMSVIETTNEINSEKNLYTIKLVSNSLASPSLIQENTTLTVSAPNAISYQWYINGVEINDAIDSTFTYTNNGVYSVKFTDIHGCEYSIGSVTITDVGIENISKAEFNIFPNPNNGQFSISDDNPNEKFTIYNAVGKSVITDISNGAVVNLNTSGVYFILSSTGKSQKIIVN